MKTRTRDTLATAATLLAYGWLPYSLSCIAFGGALYTAGRLLGEIPEEEISLILGMPVLLPVFVWDRLTRAIQQKKWSSEKGQEIKGLACLWIRVLLIREGIPVNHAVVKRHGLPSFPIYAEVSPNKVRAFQRVITETLRVFPRIPIEQLIGDIEPRHLLDRAWAERVGATDWNVELQHPPCPHCKSSMGSTWIWGKNNLNVHPNREVTHVFKDGGQQRYASQLCEACRKHLGVVRTFSVRTYT